MGDAGRAVLCCGLGGLVPPARAVLSAPVCELWATGHAGGNRSLSGKSSAAPSWTRLSLVPITSGDLGAPSAQLNYLLCSSPVTGELRGRGLPTPFLLAWFSDDMDSVCHVCGYVVQEEPRDGATARRPGSPKLRRCPRLLAARPKTVLFLFLFRAGQSPLGSLSEAWSQREARTRPLVSPAACRERTQPSEGVPREMEKQTSSSSVAAWRAGWLRPAEGPGGSERPRVVQRVVSSTQGVSQQLPCPRRPSPAPGRKLPQGPDRGSHQPETAPFARLSQTPGVAATSETRRVTGHGACAPRSGPVLLTRGRGCCQEQQDDCERLADDSRSGEQRGAAASCLARGASVRSGGLRVRWGEPTALGAPFVERFRF